MYFRLNLFLLLANLIYCSDSLLVELVDELKKESPIPRMYSPWRSHYYKPFALGEQLASGCRFCDIIKNKNANDYILFQAELTTVMLNLYPYTPWGHLLIIPHQHCSKIAELSAESQQALIKVIGICETILYEVFKIDSLNVGVNIGRAAGASIPQHVHFHMVPRKIGEEGFITTVGNVALISVDLNILFEQLKKAFDKIERF